MQSPCILVADAEALVRWSIGQRLEQAGYRVLEAKDRDQAIEQMRRRVDLVLLDGRLGGGDGASIVEQIRAIRPGCVAVLLTTGTGTGIEQQARALGVHHVLYKPFKLDRVVETVQDALKPRAAG